MVCQHDNVYNMYILYWSRCRGDGCLFDDSRSLRCPGAVHTMFYIIVTCSVRARWFIVTCGIPTHGLIHTTSSCRAGCMYANEYIYDVIKMTLFVRQSIHPAERLRLETTGGWQSCTFHTWGYTQLKMDVIDMGMNCLYIMFSICICVPKNC